jgi:hypothetical protein
MAFNYEVQDRVKLSVTSKNKLTLSGKIPGKVSEKSKNSIRDDTTTDIYLDLALADQTKEAIPEKSKTPAKVRSKRRSATQKGKSNKGK